MMAVIEYDTKYVGRAYATKTLGRFMMSICVTAEISYGIETPLRGRSTGPKDRSFLYSIFRTCQVTDSDPSLDRCNDNFESLNGN